MKVFNTALYRAYRTEMRKMLTRHDTLILFAVILIPAVVSVGYVYGGDFLKITAESVCLNAISFAAQMVYMSVAMFIFPFVWAIYTVRFHAAEIEGGYLLLYIPRIPKRSSLYYGKSLVLHMFVFFSMILTFIIGVVFYFGVFAPDASQTAAKTLSCPDDLFRNLAFCFAAFSVYALTVEITMMIGTFVKFLTAAVFYLIIFFAWNIMVYFPFLQFLTPFFYLDEYTGLKSGALELGLSLPYLQPGMLFLLNVMMLIIYCSVTTIIGVKKFKNCDLA